MAILLPRLQKFCCCLSLRVGSLIIGYISIVLSLLTLTVLSFSLYKVITYVETHDGTDKQHSPEEYATAANSLYIVHSYMMIVYLYNIIISVMLIIGVHMNKTILMRSYFQSGLFLFVLVLATVVVSTVFLHFIATIIFLIWSVIIFYCLLVVRSTYLEIEEKNKTRDFEMQNLYIAHRAPLLQS